MDLSPFEPFEGLEHPDAISFDFGVPQEGDLSLFSPAPLRASLASPSESSEHSHEGGLQSAEHSQSDSSPEKRRKGGRRLREESEDDDGPPIVFDPARRPGNAFAFSRAELQRLTPAGLDAYEAQVAAHHVLSSDETALLKKYRRQVRNRASAQNSRARKRQHTEALEEQVARLKEENDALRARAEKAEARVRQLEQMRRGGGLMLALVLAVGLCGFVSLPGVSRAPSLALPGAVKSSAARRLLAAPPTPNESSSSGRAPTVPLVDSGSRRRGMRIVDAADEERRNGVRMVDHSHPSGPDRSEDRGGLLRVHSRPSDFGARWNRPDTDYLYCPTAAHVLSTADGPPSRISLILPGDAFNSSAMNAFEGGKPPALVEVTCSVLDMWPIFWEHPNQLPHSA